MARKTYWTYKRMKERAAKYTDYKKFREKEQSLYRVAIRRGVLDDIASHMPRGATRGNKYWTLEQLLEVAKEYDNVADFRRDYPSAYIIAIRDRHFEEVTGHMKRHNDNRE